MSPITHSSLKARPPAGGEGQHLQRTARPVSARAVRPAATSEPRRPRRPYWAFPSTRGPQAALAPLEGLVLGLRQHGAGFDGLMRTEDTAGLPAGVVVEAPTLEQIVVALAKEGHHA